MIKTIKMERESRSTTQKETLPTVLRLIDVDNQQLSVNSSLRKHFLEYLENVKDWGAMEITDDNWKELLRGLRQVVKQNEDYDQGNAAVMVFAEIIKKRPFDKLKILSTLNEQRGAVAKDENGNLTVPAADDL